MDGAKIVCIERVLIAAKDLAAASDNWAAAGFAVRNEHIGPHKMRYLRVAAGAIAIDLCAAPADDCPLREAIDEALADDGGIVGWIWGIQRDSASPAAVGAHDAPVATPLGGVLTLPGMFTELNLVESSPDTRRADLAGECGTNRNTVNYLEHIVVMTGQLEAAIADYERLGLKCRRVREAGRGMRQAFFKLEQTVIEVAGPSPGRPRGWGLAFMCADIGVAVNAARLAGLEATEPKPAVQGGLIARLIDPLDGVAIAFMQSGVPRPA